MASRKIRHLAVLLGGGVGVALLLAAMSHRRAAPTHAHRGVTSSASGERRGDEPLPTPDTSPGGIEGIVRDAKRQPVAGAEVAAIAVVDPVGGTRLGATTVVQTARDGSFRFSSLAPGNYALTARADRSVARAGPIAVIARRVAQGVELQLYGQVVLVSGSVEGADGGALPGAEVRALGKVDAGEVFSTKCDGRGSYRLLLPAGDWVVAAHADGYATDQKNVQLADSLTLDFKLRPGALVRGRVIRKDGGPVAAASVLATPSSAHRPAPAAARSTTTAAGGLFELRDLAPGPYRIVAYEGDWVGKSAREVIVPLGGVLEDVSITLDHGVAITGRIASTTGAPIEGAEVYVRGPGGTRLQRTPGDGGYRIAGLLPGRYSVSARSPGFVAGLKEGLAVARHDLENVDLALAAGGEVIGEVVTSEGQPVEDANVVALGAGSMALDRSTPDGRFRLAGLAEGQARIVATHPRYGQASAVTLRIVAGSVAQVTVKFDEDGSIAGTVRFSGGDPAAGVFVHAISASGRTQEGTTAADGTFTLGPFGPGPVAVSVGRKSGLKFAIAATTHSQVVKLAAHEHRTGVDLELPRTGAALSGVVIGPDGSPMSGATVILVEEQASGAAIRLPRSLGGPDATTQTGDDGSFSFVDIAQSRFSLWAQATGYAEGKATHVAAGASGVQIQLGPESTLSGIVVEPSGRPVTRYAIAARQKGVGLSSPPAQQVHNPRGAFQIHRLPSGTYAVEVMSRYGYARLDDIQLTDGESKSGLIVTLMPLRSRPGP